MIRYSAKDRMRSKIISKKLSAFGFGPIQDAKNILNALKRNNISIDEFIRWTAYMQDARTRAVHNGRVSDKTNKEYKCPICELPLTLITVNSTPCTIVDGKYKSLLYCYDDIGCGYELFSKRSVEYWEEISSKIGANVWDVFRNNNSKSLDRALHNAGITMESNSNSKSKCSGCSKK